jgi:hypothetical protein
MNRLWKSYSGKSPLGMSRGYVLCMLAIIQLLLAGGSVPGYGQQSAEEFQIKAACLYNFLKFVEWPDKDRKEKDIITIGIIGEDPFGDHFSNVEGKLVKNDKKLNITRHGPHKAENRYSKDDLVFICSSELSNFEEILKGLKAAQVLTVSDSGDFLGAGGMISLLERNKQIRWEINREPIRGAGLRVNSQLLRTAARVID